MIQLILRLGWQALTRYGAAAGRWLWSGAAAVAESRLPAALQGPTQRFQDAYKIAQTNPVSGMPLKMFLTKGWRVAASIVTLAATTSFVFIAGLWVPVSVLQSDQATVQQQAAAGELLARPSPDEESLDLLRRTNEQVSAGATGFAESLERSKKLDASIVQMRKNQDELEASLRSAAERSAAKRSAAARAAAAAAGRAPQPAEMIIPRHVWARLNGTWSGTARTQCGLSLTSILRVITGADGAIAGTFTFEDVKSNQEVTSCADLEERRGDRYVEPLVNASFDGNILSFAVKWKYSDNPIPIRLRFVNEALISNLGGTVTVLRRVE